MIIYKNFSDKEEKKERSKNIAGLGLLAYKITPPIANVVLSGKIKKISNDSELNKKIKDEILEEAKKSGVDVIEGEGLSPKYTGKSKLYKKLGKIGEEVGDSLESIDNSIVKGLGKSIKSKYKWAGDDKVIIGEGSLGDPDILAHELGHRHYMTGEGKGLGKILHKTRGISSLGMMASPISSFALGLRSAKKEDKGEKESGLEKNAHLVLPVASSIPVVGSEIAADRYALEKLRKHGADPIIIKNAKKKYAYALGTYGIGVGKSILGSIISKEAGKAVGRKMIKNKKEKEDDSNT